jgi:hypothetical protein
MLDVMAVPVLAAADAVMDQDPAAAEAPYQLSCLLLRVFAEGKESRGIEVKLFIRKPPFCI